jgi:hypothetical protein
MKEELKDLAAELGPGGEDVTSQWVWVEEDGSRTPVDADTQSQGEPSRPCRAIFLIRPLMTCLLRPLESED